MSLIRLAFWILDVDIKVLIIDKINVIVLDTDPIYGTCKLMSL